MVTGAVLGVALLMSVSGTDLHNFLRRLLQHQFFVNFADARFFLQEFGAAPCTIFLGGGYGHIVVNAADASGVFFVNHQRVLVGIEAHGAALGIDVVLAVFLVPLRDGRVLVHVLDDLAPADARVVRAEGNFTLLRRVRDDAHFGAAEIVVKQVLEPHARDHQEVPRIGVAALHGVFVGALRACGSVLLALILGQAPGLVELLPQVDQAESSRALPYGL